MTIQARDGDRGQPRKIAYDLVTSTFDDQSFGVTSNEFNFRSNGLFLVERQNR